MNDDPDISQIKDPRHHRRVEIVQQLYAFSFDPEFVYEDKSKTIDTVREIIQHKEVLDKYIVNHAPKYPLDQIAKADLAIMRLAIFELMFDKKEPSKVIINEAVELAKELGSDRSYAFVNAVLGAIISESTLTVTPDKKV